MLLSLQDVKFSFPEWGNYFFDVTRAPSDDTLLLEMGNAEAEMLRYLPGISAESLTPQLKKILIDIVIYNGFKRVHGDRDFETQPAIVRDYREGITRLETSASPAADSDELKKHTVRGKSGKFGSWYDESSQ